MITLCLEWKESKKSEKYSFTVDDTKEFIERLNRCIRPPFVYSFTKWLSSERHNEDYADIELQKKKREKEEAKSFSNYLTNNRQ